MATKQLFQTVGWAWAHAVNSTTYTKAHIQACEIREVAVTVRDRAEVGVAAPTAPAEDARTARTQKPTISPLPHITSHIIHFITL